MENQNKLEQAIRIIEDANEKVCKLLKDHENLLIRSNHVMTTLANGLKHVHGSFPQVPLGSLDQGMSTFVVQPMVSARIMPQVEDSEPQKADIEDYKERVHKAYSSFLEREPKDLIDSLQEKEIRGVAKLAGMEVTPTEPEHISIEFIKEIKEAIKLKAATDNATKPGKAVKSK